MKRLNDNEIVLTQSELDNIQSFIRTTLYSDWDQHTNHYSCPDTSIQDGMRRMDPEMYDMAQQMDIV